MHWISYQIHGGPCGTENLQNDHWLVKYLGIICRPCSLLRASSILNIWMVPWSDETHTFVVSILKLMQYILACKHHKCIWNVNVNFARRVNSFRCVVLTWCVPRRNSATLAPSAVSKMRINVPRSPAVANRVPCIFNARHVTADSWAMISMGALSILARSTIFPKRHTKWILIISKIDNRTNVC